MRRTVSQKDRLCLRTKLSMGVHFLLMFEKIPAKDLILLILVTEAMSEIYVLVNPSPPLSLLRYKSMRRLGNRPSYSFTAETVPTAAGGRPRMQRSGERDEKER